MLVSIAFCTCQSCRPQTRARVSPSRRHQGLRRRCRPLASELSRWLNLRTANPIPNTRYTMSLAQVRQAAELTSNIEDSDRLCCRVAAVVFVDAISRETSHLLHSTTHHRNSSGREVGPFHHLRYHSRSTHGEHGKEHRMAMERLSRRPTPLLCSAFQWSAS